MQGESDQMNGREFLLTGATGFLGKVVLHELLRRRETLGVERVHVLIRTNSSSTAENRFETDIAASRCFADLAPNWRDSVEVVACDLSLPGAGLESGKRELLTKRVTHTINCAASVQFNLPLRDAATANVSTALEVLDLAKSCDRLVSLVSVSTAYVTPHSSDGGTVSEELVPLPWPAADVHDAILRGEVDEQELLAESGHPNTYTLTKCIAEHLLCERRSDIELTLVRPSVISASMHEPFPGWIDSPAAFALFTAEIGSGRMRTIMARPHARIDVIPCDAVADRLIDAACRPNSGNGHGLPLILHAVAGYEHSPNVRLCCNTIEAFFSQNPDTRWRNRDVPARVRYLGPDGPLYRINHWLHHERPLNSRRKAERLSQANRMFAYFTHNTFRFRSSAPFDPPGFEPAAYIETVCRGVAQHLMGADNAAVPIAGRLHPRSRGDLRWALTQRRGNAFVRFAAYLVVKALRRCTDRVTFDLTSFEDALKEVPPGSPLVLVPSHRSYLDFVLCSLLMFARPDLGIAIPHIAATSDFARIPVLSWLFLRMHAFYLRRGLGREDKKLTQQVHSLMSTGRVLEFFIEGRRSRSRQFLPPRRGLLRCLQSTGVVCTVLPIAFSYDHVPEEAAFIDELGGAPKPPMQLRGLLRWTGRLLQNKVSLGRTHIACGRPVTLEPDSDVYAVSHDIMAELQQKTVATTHHLHTFLDSEAGNLEDIDLSWLREAITRRGGRVLDTQRRDQIVSPLIARCMRYQFEHLFYEEAALAFAGHPAIENHIRLNRYAQSGPPNPRVERQDPRVLRLLRSLFGPVVRDYQVVSAALGEPDTPLVLNSPMAVTQSRPGENLHFPDVEGAFTDLTERRILLYDQDKKNYSWGPKAADIASYRAWLVRI
ncbi:MAG: SDR family oxidoreductase [Gammaproteobacteria bacterium]